MIKFVLNPKTGIPFYRQIIDQIRFGIAAGNLSTGEQLPTVSSIKAEETLTKDTVPVNVDAVVYWTVWDVEKSALEVQDYVQAVTYIAQTGLRDTIGKYELSDLLSDREKISTELQGILDEHTNPWGITCQNV